MLNALILDFGGVIAEEGFKNGLHHIAKLENLDPDSFFATCSELTYTTGFLVQEANETEYWQAVRQATGVSLSDDEMKRIILERFIVRPDVLKTVDEANALGIKTGILSDQVNWLDELNAMNGHFFQKFDVVYNSWHKMRTKRDLRFFTEILNELGVTAKEAAFVDDNAGHVERAASLGITTHHYTDLAGYLDFADRVFDSFRG